MIIGDPSIFAIESGISEAYERLSLLSLGFFVIHINGRRYGVFEPDATMLACSFGAVEERITHRGRHTAPFANELDAGKIADAFRHAIFADEPEDEYFENSRESFKELFYTQSVDRMWAPDGDQAFDDRSYVLHFDVEDRVRLIAFQCQDGISYTHGTLSDVWLAADDFYNILRQWHDSFDAQWAAMPKSPDAIDDMP